MQIIIKAWQNFGKMFWGQEFQTIYDVGIEAENKRIMQGIFEYRGPEYDRINLIGDSKKIKGDFRRANEKLKNSAIA